jgi:hypothetical protein
VIRKPVCRPRHRRFVDAKAPARRLRSRHNRRKAARFRPIERPQIKFGVGCELARAFVRKADPFVQRNDRRQPHLLRRAIDTGAMKIEVRHYSLEGARAVKHRGPSRSAVRARTMIGTFPSCQPPLKKVQVLDQGITAIRAPRRTRICFAPIAAATDSSHSTVSVQRFETWLAPPQGAMVEAESALPKPQRSPSAPKSEEGRDGRTSSQYNLNQPWSRFREASP